MPQDENFKAKQDAAVALLKDDNPSLMLELCFPDDPEASVCDICGCIVSLSTVMRKRHAKWHADIVSLQTICGVMAPMAMVEHTIRKAARG